MLKLIMRRTKVRPVWTIFEAKLRVPISERSSLFEQDARSAQNSRAVLSSVTFTGDRRASRASVCLRRFRDIQAVCPSSFSSARGMPRSEQSDVRIWSCLSQDGEPGGPAMKNSSS